MNVDTRNKVFSAVIFCIILLLAALLRLDGLTSESAWVDEFIAINHAAGHPLNAPQPDRPDDVLLFPAPSPASLIGASPWNAAWSSVRDDIHPPLYFQVLRLWLNSFGDSDSAARMLSVVCSLVAIVLFYDVCRLLHRRPTALWACALMALSLTQIRYAQEARNYAMITALSLLACSAAVRIERLGGNLRRYLALFVAALTLPLTHYLSIVPLLALSIYVLIRLQRQHNRPAMRGVIIAFVAAGALFLLIGGPVLWHQRQNAEQVNLRFDREPGRLQRTLERVSTIPARYIGDTLDSNPLTTARITGQFARATWPLAPMIIVYVVPLMVLRRRPDLLLWVLLLLAGIAPVIASDLMRETGNLQLIRYALLGAPAAFALTAASLSHLRNPILAHAFPVLMLIFAACVLPMKFQSIKPDYRDLVAQLRVAASPDDAIVIAGSDPGPWYLMTMYQGVMRYLYPAPCPVAVITHVPDEPLLAQLRARRRLWVVWGSQTLDPSSVLPGARHQIVGEYRNLGFLMRIELPGGSATTAQLSTSRPSSQ
ncbi:MAG: glycosyltransferase family 39 protein [Anaerolineae bacterium]|nr:glycosyltransferase family 39 protein [Phycisphaerae bacterium]